MYVAVTIAALIVGWLAGILTSRRLPPPHPQHCSEVAWCTHCGMPSGARCPDHKRAAAGAPLPQQR